MTLSKQPSPSGARARLAAAYVPARAAAAGKAAKPAVSAWERWEMGTLNEPAAAPLPPRKSDATSVPLPIVAKASVDEAELRRLRLEARALGEAEGRQDGWTQGHAEGHTAGLATGLAAASAHAEHLRALAATLPAALQRAQSELADAILTLALDVARQVVHRTLRAEPEWVLPLVQDLLHAEPALQGEPRLLLHPDDVALVKNSLGNELQIAGWQVRPDDTMARGSVRVQSASGEMDASLETRWKSVTAALHRDVDAS
ncbi:flagellar assembly protein FliH [Variovorax sp. PBL-E5]|uniref:flagellar assembly protein FliH n=1 Tax=Variovorax sp. PBL-E5 TaxID=434014 RepID=UPI001318A2FA|nr:flagellar assembly protein FliH [Variovorax sp. PBL-E5]VTU33361.1 Flagellar assembly protein FliH [Variovorax sp. PBL-E5]